MKFNKETKQELIELLEKKNIGLEGNILKIIDSSDDPDFTKYLENCKDRQYSPPSPPSTPSKYVSALAIISSLRSYLTLLVEE